ncbi:RagB/SusD family nutrient uptake outer membrane protein [Mucilaginibacter sp.]
MRKTYVSASVFMLLCFIVLAISSCKKEGFLSATATTNLNQQTIFTDSANAEGFLANIYTNVGFSISPTRFSYTTVAGVSIPCGGLDAACDESEISHTYSTAALAFALGSVNAGNVPDGNTADAYYVCYQQIRAVNQLFANISKVPLLSATKTQMLAEARFLRAWYYFILLEHYGGVPIVGNAIYDYTQVIPTKRSTFDQCVTYITGQCDSAAQVLPLVQTSLNYGRASGGACLALKARVLLYAASPLFNKPSSMASVQAPFDIASAAVKPLVGYPSYNATRWATAEAAAMAVIQTNAYQLFTDSVNLPGYGEEKPFQYLFTIRKTSTLPGNAINNEYIFQLMFPPNDYLEDLFQPPSRTGANGAFPYQGTVDAFPMANGKAITDPTSGYDPTNPYAKRDPRLAATIIYDQSLLGNRTPNGQIQGYSPVDIYLTNNNGTLSGGTDAVYQGTPTGYYHNKMLDPDAIANGLLLNPTQRCLPLMRYADILLDYAEAANENEGPTTLVYQYVNEIRQRAGLNPYALPTGLTQAQMRAAIQTERQCELAYEGYRFFDVRRWLIADQTENIEAQGMEVDRTLTTTTYKIFPVRKHNFTPKMYLWPFPQAEIGKGGGLVQNPGY